MQNDLVKCCFDIWLSSTKISSSLIKKCLFAFNLNSAHLLCILHERVHLKIEDSKAVANTTKQMKKQLKQFNMNNLVELDWKCLKYLLEYLQFYFSFGETKMDTDEQTRTAVFIELISYLFLSLETIETTLSCNLVGTNKLDSVLLKKGSDEVEITVNKTQQSYLNNEDNLLQYLEIMSLSCLLSIYKMNIEKDKTALTPAQFNIELLMQILQTKRETDTSEDETQEPKIDNLNVQEHVLLLLSEIAGVFPDKVLEHVLIMFVFVGTKLARKDDSYSFQIINKIIQTILPSIVNSINLSNENVTDLGKNCLFFYLLNEANLSL